MATCFEYDEEGNVVHWYDPGDAECPTCGSPVAGRFQHGVLVGLEPCAFCRAADPPYYLRHQ